MSKEPEYEITNFANSLNKDCMNLMECIKKQDKDNKPILYLGKHFKKVILPYEEYQKMCNRLESIDNANPSEALECLEKIIDNLDDYADFEIKQEANEYIDTIKQALIKAQEPKKYLKWEDLEFGINKHNLKCKMNDNFYRIEWFIDGMGFKTVNIYLYVAKGYLEYCTHLQDDKKQFFNDLHLERVEE